MQVLAFEYFLATIDITKVHSHPLRFISFKRENLWIIVLLFSQASKNSYAVYSS